MVDRWLWRFLLWFTARLKRKGKYLAIYRDRTRSGTPQDLYLERWYVLDLWLVKVLIHRFWLSDDDGLHDHPWSWVSIPILGRGYREEHFGWGFDEYGVPSLGWTWRPRWKPYVRFRGEMHRVNLQAAKPGSVWTLFIHGPRRRLWGFIPRHLETDYEVEWATGSNTKYANKIDKAGVLKRARERGLAKSRGVNVDHRDRAGLMSTVPPLDIYRNL